MVLCDFTADIMAFGKVSNESKLLLHLKHRDAGDSETDWGPESTRFKPTRCKVAVRINRKWFYHETDECRLKSVGRGTWLRTNTKRVLDLKLSYINTEVRISICYHIRTGGGATGTGWVRSWLCSGTCCVNLQGPETWDLSWRSKVSKPILSEPTEAGGVQIRMKGWTWKLFPGCKSNRRFIEV